MEPIHDLVHQLFCRKKGYAETADFLEQGIKPYFINKLLKEGLISRVKRGLYQYNNADWLPHTEIIEVSHLVPNGVICLSSAAAHHELSTINPWQYHVAIERSQKSPKLPSYPPIQIYYFNKTAFENNVEEREIEGHPIKIYSKEKTICDLIRYRNKIGADIMIESIKNYMRLPTRNVTKLFEIGKEQQVDKILRNYIEVLL